VSGRIVVGTSSWADPGFVAEWYPKDLPANERLAWYAQRFEGVELNSSFYAVPRAELAERWAGDTPEGFTFDVKLHRLLSRHSAGLDSLPPDLRERARTNERGRVILTPELEADLAERMTEAVQPLARAGKMSSFLLQLSPAFEPRRHRLDELEGLLGALAPYRVAVELRHRGWVSDTRRDDTLAWLRDHGAAFVAVDAPPGDAPTLMPPVDAVTSPLAYFRLHGRNTEGYLRGKSVAERFAWRYSEDELREHAERAERLSEDADEVRVMYNNNRGNDAPLAAHHLRELIGQDAGPPVPDRRADDGNTQLTLG
jgi:uncharacterized protein YecE (DUF72 family)